MHTTKKVGFFLIVFVLVSQISVNLARPSRGNKRNRGRDNKAKRTWPDSAGPIVTDTKVESDNIFASAADLDAASELNELEIQQGTEASMKTPPTKWLDLERTMPSTLSAPINSDIILECNAVGSPPPQVYWLKDGKPVEHMSPLDLDRFANQVFGWDLVKRGGMGKEDFAMANVKSKLPLKCLKPADVGEYTCIAENEGKQLIATTLVSIDDSLSTDLRPECLAQYTKKGKKIQPAFIMTYEYLHMETIGNDVVLRCQVGGRPYPQVSWTDFEGKVIGQGKKFKITESGNLVIRNLSWREMGEYTCRAANEFGSESAATFLYPLLRESSR